MYSSQVFTRNMTFSCLFSQLMFTATRGTSYTGDIAIDDISFSSGCSYGKLSEEERD